MPASVGGVPLGLFTQDASVPLKLLRELLGRLGRLGEVSRQDGAEPGDDLVDAAHVLLYRWQTHETDLGVRPTLLLQESNRRVRHGERAPNVRRQRQLFVAVHVHHPLGASLFGFSQRSVTRPREVIAPADVDRLDTVDRLDPRARGRRVEQQDRVGHGRARTKRFVEKRAVRTGVRERRRNDHRARRAATSALRASTCADSSWIARSAGATNRL